MYRKFNNLIYDNFFNNEGIGDSIILTVDEETITDIAAQMKTLKDELLISIKDYLKDDWKKIKYINIDGIPQYLGLIAVQVYAAHLMQKKDGEYTEKAYLTHLNQLFGYEGNNKIESLFKNYQDEIWKSLKKWALDKGFNIHLPGEKKGKSRYVQYPLSQALLNREDLVRVPILFHEAEIGTVENFSFEDFTALVFPVLCGKITRHFDKVYSKYPEGVQRQIFKYYQQWDGTIPGTKQRDKTIRSQNLIKNNDDLILERLQVNDDKSLFNLYIAGEYNCRKAEFSLKDSNLFPEIRKFYRPPHKDIIIFTQDVDYGDWIATRFLKLRISCLVLFRKDHPESYRMLQHFRRIAKNDYSIDLYHLIEIFVNDTADVTEPIKKYFSKSKINVILQNGLKLDRKTWMEGAGPDILIEGEITKWWLDGEKKENYKYSCRNLPIGEHSIKIPDNSPVKFFIETPGEKFPQLEKGWKVAINPPLWGSASESPTIKGLMLAGTVDKEDESIVLQWSNALINKGEKGQNQSSPVVINAIRRKYHGIR